MKINGTFKTSILRRFLTPEELEELQTSYDEAKVIVVGNKAIKRQGDVLAEAIGYDKSKLEALTIKKQDDE